MAIAKEKDFRFWFEQIVKTANNETFRNFCFYNGKELKRIKEDGTVSVKSLPFKVFVSRFNCSFVNYFESDLIVENGDSEKLFNEALKGLVSTSKVFADVDRNATEVLKSEIKIKAYRAKNAALKRPSKKGKK